MISAFPGADGRNVNQHFISALADRVVVENAARRGSGAHRNHHFGSGI